MAAATMSLIKDDLTQSLSDQCGLSKQTSRPLVETTFELIKKALESGDDVLISGFGKFSVREKGARKGRNHATGEDLILDARRVVTFRCSAILREKVNAGG
jgi:integration host factor subunit alpha